MGSFPESWLGVEVASHEDVVSEKGGGSQRMNITGHVIMAWPDYESMVEDRRQAAAALDQAKAALDAAALDMDVRAILADMCAQMPACRDRARPEVAKVVVSGGSE